MNNNTYVPTPLVKSADTLPAKIVDMKISAAAVDPIDMIGSNGENVKISLTYSEMGLEQTLPTSFLLSLGDLDTGIWTNSVIDAKKGTYKFWTEYVRKFSEILEDGRSPSDIDLGNYRVVLTPMNDLGKGPNSTFLVPLKDTVIDFTEGAKCIYKNDTLALNWHLFSETPEERKNRPKTMHIYLDVPKEDIESDKALLNEDEWKYTSVGDWQITNSKMFRWLLNEEEWKLTEAGWTNLSTEESKFISDLLKDVRSEFMHQMALKGIMFGDPFIFKTLIENPTDKEDTILLYIMKGCRWQL